MRNEHKIVLTPTQYIVLSARMRALLPPDDHMPSPDGYLVSSLYLDTERDRAYEEKLAGSCDRRKYRLRIYGADASKVFLECKQKFRDRIGKRSEPMSAEGYLAVCHGDFSPLSSGGALSREVFALSRTERLQPRVAVTYRREAYLHPLSGTRITFDKELRAGCSPEAMTRQVSGASCAVFPIGDFPWQGAVIMEIKYNTCIARYLTEALQIGGVTLAASKYVLCRDRLQSLRQVWHAGALCANNLTERKGSPRRGGEDGEEDDALKSYPDI